MGRTKKTQQNLGNALMRAQVRSRIETKSSLSDRHMHDNSIEQEAVQDTKLKSIIESNDLEEFMNEAYLAGRDFTAEHGITMVVNNIPQVFEVDQDGQSLTLKQIKRSEVLDADLPIPRRPPWEKTMTRVELHNSERESFLEWRRELAKVEQEYNVVMTPYEKNIEVWKQLWRVTERCNILVQIVDCRNPLAFRCLDLERYVKELDPSKMNVLLLNKSDLLTEKQRIRWAHYLRAKQIQFIFFSAMKSQEVIDNLEDETNAMNFDDLDMKHYTNPMDENIAHVFSREELLLYFKSLVSTFVKKQTSTTTTTTNNPTNNPNLDEHRIAVGMVGYPNVGKSSLINVLSGKKRVAVGSTPGKTKHFQTIPIGKEILLCDCPGLVFPSITTTKADMICDGILPIDQMRDHRAPIQLLCERIPQKVFEVMYGLTFESKKRSKKRRNEPLNCDELLDEFARSRGLMAQKGTINGPAAARILLKDYTAGRVIFCHPPPDDLDSGEVIDEAELDEADDDEYETEEEEVINGSDDEIDNFSDGEEEEEFDDEEAEVEEDEEGGATAELRISKPSARAELPEEDDEDEEENQLLDTRPSTIPDIRKATSYELDFNKENVNTQVLKQKQEKMEKKKGYKAEYEVDSDEEFIVGAPTMQGVGAVNATPSSQFAPRVMRELQKASDHHETIDKMRQRKDLSDRERKDLKALKRRMTTLKKMY